jgi:hypothetical protein
MLQSWGGSTPATAASPFMVRGQGSEVSDQALTPESGQHHRVRFRSIDTNRSALLPRRAAVIG